MQSVNSFSGVKEAVVPGTERDVYGSSPTFAKKADGPPSPATAAAPASSMPLISRAPCSASVHATLRMPPIMMYSIVTSDNRQAPISNACSPPKSRLEMIPPA